MHQTFYGYMRVSTMEQNDERQKRELLRWGIVEKNIFSDKISGKDFNRPQYQKLRKMLNAGDVLVIKSIDRLGRNYEEIQNQWRYIVKKKKADIVIIDMPILDTRTNKDLIGTLISDIVLQLLSYVAQAEREYLRQRQAEGIAIARAKGVRFGPLPRPLPEKFTHFYRLWRMGAVTTPEIMHKLKITENQFRWFVRRQKMLDDAEYEAEYEAKYGAIHEK